MRIIEFIQKKEAQPDFQQFIEVVTKKRKPAKVHQVELLIDQEIISAISQKYFLEEMVPLTSQTQRQYIQQYVNWWYRMGYDYTMIIDIPGIGLEFPSQMRKTDDTAYLSRGTRNWVEEKKGIIANWENFENYPWPDPEDIDLSPYLLAQEEMPEGMKLLVAGSSGLLEVVSENLLGIENMSYLLFDEPDLVEAVFEKVGNIMYRFYLRLADLEGIGGFFQGDDMGFKTSTILSPALLKKYVLPWHKKVCTLAHLKGKVYFLHSCGQLKPIMDDLISWVGIDAFHSFQDEIMSVVEFKQEYGWKIGVLGGIDLDRLVRSNEAELRSYVRSILEKCQNNGGYALGSGNSIANYVPINNYLIMLDEGLAYA